MKGVRGRCDRCAALWRVEQGERVMVAGPAALSRLRQAGTDPAHGDGREALRRATQRAHQAARERWEQRYGASGDPARWERIRVRLAGLPVSRIAEASGYCLRWASKVRAGEVVPHPRTWAALERLGRG